jgi:GLPGLI family protein
MQMAIGMIQGSTLDVHFKDKMTRSEMKMGAMMNIVTIYNETSGEVLMLMSGMVGQNAIKITTAELAANEAEKPQITMELINETKTIQEYTCKKAILTDEDGVETVFWYTDEVVVSKKGQSYLNADIPGFPMQYEMNNNGMKMTMNVTKLEKKLDKKSASLFEMTIPSGYKIMTMEEIKALGM